MLTAVLLASAFPLQAEASSLLRLDGTNCVFTYPAFDVGDAIRLTNVSEINTSDRFFTMDYTADDENAVVYGQTTLTLLTSGLLYANRWNGNRDGSGTNVEKTLWANNVVNEPSTKNIGCTLTLSEPGYYQIPFGVGGSYYMFSVEVRPAAADYATYLKGLIAQYGVLPQFSQNSFPMCDESIAKGVFYAGLKDFDGNGSNELVVMYNKGYVPEHDFDDLGVVYEVWSDQSGSLKMLYSNADNRGLPYRMSDSGALASIGLIQSDGKQYMHLRVSGSSIYYKDLTDELYTIIDGKWQKTHTLVLKTAYEDEDGPIEPITTYTVDGAPITEAQYIRSYSDLAAGETTLISSLDNDYKLHIAVPDYRAGVLAAAQSLSGAKTTRPSAASVLVDGRSVQFQAYEIENNNYFKLRDIAAVISGTSRQFDVEWDSAQNAIKLISGNAYTAVGGELATASSGYTGSVMQSKSSVLLDGKAVSLTAYTIADNNYFKLRDLAQTLHFDVRWDAAAGTIIIDTTQDYSAQ